MANRHDLALVVVRLGGQAHGQRRRAHKMCIRDRGIWVSVFTAISAFCNAGFDLFGQFGAYSSLVPYVHNYYVQAVVMFMIIAGGLGFMVWVELIQYPKKRKLSLHARVVLIFSVLLWVGGAALIGLMEWNNPASMGGLSPVSYTHLDVYKRQFLIL